MRQTLILGGIAVLLVALAGGLLFFFTSSPNTSGSEGSSGGGIFGSLFPFGNKAPETPSGSDTPDTAVDEPTVSRAIPVLRKVSDGPSAGGILFENADKSIGIRYIERATGHIFETSSGTLTTKRVSNTTVPGIQEALWITKNSVIIRYLNDDGNIETFLGTLASTTAEQSLNGKFIASWDRAALDPGRKTFFSINKTASGSTLYTAKSDGSARTAVYTSPISSWVPLQSSQSVFLQTAAAADVPGFLYRLSGQTLTKVVGDIVGLEAVVSPSGRYVFFSAAGTDGFSSYLLDTTTNEVYESPVETLAPKCTFIGDTSAEVVCGVPSIVPRGAYPTDWMLGRVSFSDEVWRVNALNGTAELLAIPSEDADAEIDVTYPTVDPAGTYFGFINKNDLAFWTLKLQ